MYLSHYLLYCSILMNWLLLYHILSPSWFPPCVCQYNQYRVLPVNMNIIIRSHDVFTTPSESSVLFCTFLKNNLNFIFSSVIFFVFCFLPSRGARGPWQQSVLLGSDGGRHGRGHRLLGQFPPDLELSEAPFVLHSITACPTKPLHTCQLVCGGPDLRWGHTLCLPKSSPVQPPSLFLLLPPPRYAPVRKY